MTVEALGREWRLHRLYLRQSPFFASLFSGAWREGAEQERVRITVADPNVTEEALHLALGSLYQVRFSIFHPHACYSLKWLPSNFHKFKAGIY